MKLEIKNAKIIDNGIPVEVFKLDIRLVPERIARFSLPYSELNRLAVSAVRCPGIDAPAFFTGTHNGIGTTGSFSGGRLIGVKHGMRGIFYEVELDNFDIHWDGKPEKMEGEATEEHERGVDANDPAPVAAESSVVESVVVGSVP